MATCRLWSAFGKPATFCHLTFPPTVCRHWFFLELLDTFVQLTNKSPCWRIMTALYFSYLPSLASWGGLLIKQTKKDYHVRLFLVGWWFEQSWYFTVLSFCSILSQPRTCWMFMWKDWHFQDHQAWCYCFSYVQSLAGLSFDDGSTRETSGRRHMVWVYLKPSCLPAILSEEQTCLSLGNDFVWI